MASSFLTKKAEEQAKKSQANAKNLQKQAKEDGRLWIPGGTTGSRTASDFLYNKAKERNATVASGTYGRQAPALPAPAQNNMAAPAAAGITGAVAGAIPQVQLPPPTQGNIDLNNRPVYRNPDGTISTVDSFSTNIDGMEVLLPQIGRDANGNAVRWTQDQAIDNYLKTGEYLGKFASVDEANRYAEWLHNQQAEMYGQQPTQTNAQSYYNDTLRPSLQQQIEAKTKERDQYDPSSRQWRKANRQLGALYWQQAQAASQAALPGSIPVLGSLLTPDSDVDVQRKKVSALYREASTLSDDHTPEGQKAYMEKLAEAEEANRVLHDMGGRYGLAEGAVTTAENLGAGVAGAVRGIGNALGYVGQLQARTAMMQADPYLRMWGQDEVADANAAEIQRARDNGLQSAAEILESVGVSGAGKVDQLIQNFQQTAAEHAQASGKVTQAIANTANGVGGMVPSILANIAVPGSGLWVMAVQAFGNATEEAINAGASDENAVLYGGAVAAVEVLTEMMFDGIPGLRRNGENVLDISKAVEKAVKNNVSSAAEQRAVMFLVNALGEGAEEFVSEIADWGLDKWLVGSDERTFKDVHKDAWYSALIGSLVSVAMSTPVEVIKAMGPKGLAERVAQEVEFRVGKHEDAIASYQEAAEKYGLMSPEAVQAQQRARETGLQARQAEADLQRTLGADPEQVRQASQLLGRMQTADATNDLGGTGTETTNAGIMLPTARENYTLPTLASEQERGIMNAEEGTQNGTERRGSVLPAQRSERADAERAGQQSEGVEKAPGGTEGQGRVSRTDETAFYGAQREAGETRRGVPAQTEQQVRIAADAKDKDVSGVAIARTEDAANISTRLKGSLNIVEDKGTKTMQRSRARAKRAGADIAYVAGSEIETADGETARGAIIVKPDGKFQILSRVDDADADADQITEHELGHKAVRTGKIKVRQTMDDFRANYHLGPEAANMIIDTYLQTNGVEPDANNQYLESDEEELLCNALGMIDDFEGMDAFAPLSAGFKEMRQFILDRLDPETRSWFDDDVDTETEAKTEPAKAPTNGEPQQALSRGPPAKPKVVDGAAVTPDVAKIMQSPEYQPPVDYMKLSVRTRDAWKKSYLEQFNSKDAERVARVVDMFTDKMIANDAIMGYVPVGSYKYDSKGPLRGNMEYIYTFDMDTSCPRTFQFLNYRDALQTTAGRPLEYNESINLLELMRAYGQQIPCAYCYVENKRVLLSSSYNNFFAFRQNVMNAETDEEALKQMYSYDEKKGKVSGAAQKVFDKWRADRSYNPGVAEVWTASQNSRNAVLNYLDAQKKSGAITDKTSTKAVMDMVKSRFGMTDKAALTEAASFVADWMYDTDAEIEHTYTIPNTEDATVDEKALALHHEALAYSKSASSAKSVENYAPYTDQLKNISKEDKDYINGMGGIRKHSSNDFRVDYVQDYIMFYADLAAGKWMGHTYTKNTDYVKIFGRTGDRINMSIAMYGDTLDTVRENLDEGMGWKDAKELRKAYKNAGVMAMVTNNAQLSYALNTEEFVDMIIPFHASGLDKAVWYNLRMWQDYTSKQLERWMNADDMKAALKEKGVEIPKGAKSADIQALYDETFKIKKIYAEDGTLVKPHFLPGDTYVNGQLVPGHHNDMKLYKKLCAEYGVHPRFDGVMVTDKNGKTINVVDHPNYVRLVKETARTDSKQGPIQFNFDEEDPFLGMTPLDYAMQRMEEEAKNGGYENTKNDPYGIVKEFKEQYLGKNRPLGYLTDRAKQYQEIRAEQQREAQEKLDKELQADEIKLSRSGKSKRSLGTVEREYVDYNDDAEKEARIDRALSEVIDSGKTVTLTHKEIGLEKGATDWGTIQKARTYVKNILTKVLGDNSVFFEMPNGTLEAYITKTGKNHYAALVSPETAAMARRIKEITDNAKYAFSSKHDIHTESGEKNAAKDWDYFVAGVKVGNSIIPVLFSVRSIEKDARAQIYGVRIGLESLAADNKAEANTSHENEHQNKSDGHASNYEGFSASANDSITDPDKTVKTDHGTDTEYLSAVERGDMETAQKMVDEAAEKAGYDISAYHATSNDFTVYDRSKLGKNTDGNASSDLLAATAHVGHWLNSLDVSSRIGARKALRQKLKMESPLRLESLDALTAWIEDNVPADGTPTEIGDAAAAELRAQGYDGIILSDEELGGTSFVILDSNQAKSADPVTYDDNGNVIPLSERFNPEKTDIRYSTSGRNQDITRLQAENKRLKKQVEYWQGQTKATEGWKADAKQEARVTKDILKSTSSKADADEMTRRITQLHEDLSNGKLTYEQGKETATAIASDIISKSERLVGKDVETYREARKILKSTPQTHVAYNQLQALMGKELFPDVLGDEARREIIDDVMGAMKPFVENPFDLQKAIVIESVADDIVNAGMEMRQAKPTAVDVERAKTAEAKAEGARALEEQRLVDRMFYERKIAEIRRQRDEKIEAVKQHQRDVNEHRREMREEANDRRRLLKLVKRLQAKTVDPVTKSQLPEILKTLDTVSVNITDKSIQNLTELRQWYHDKTTQGSDIYDPNFIPDKATLAKLDRLEKVMNGGSIGDMSIMQVRELTEVLLNIEHNMLEARKFQKSKLAIDNYEAGMRLIQDIDNAVPGGINRELSPLRAARRIAGYNDGTIEGTEASPVITLMQECIAGERAAQMYTREATHMLSKYLNDKAFMRALYGRRAQEITITGYDAKTGEKKSVAITPAMRISLYLHSLNDDNMRHVQEGGVLIPDMRLYKKGNLAEAYAADNRLKLTKQNVASICANMTQQERGFARALWRYFNEYAPKSLNEASVLLDGYEKFNVENYFPISVDSNFLGQDYQQMVMESDGSLTHPGFGEERIQSSKPIYLRDVNDVFRTAVDQNAAYACKAVPLSNLNKLINVQQVGAVDSVSAALDRRFTAKKKSPVTTSAADYLAKFMRDYAGNRGGKKSGIDKMLAKIRSNYSGAVLTLAGGTAIKQAASYPTAAAVVSTKSLTQALNPARTVDVSFIDKYTATFTQRTEGYSSVEQAELSQEGRRIPKALNWIQAVDVATTKALKRAAAIEVQNTTKLTPGTREYELAVVDMYQRIIEETQPNYSTALRPDILRSDSALERALVMFATQPMQNFGILYDAVNDFSAKRRAYMNTESASAKKAYQAAGKKLGKAIGSQLASSLVFALMQAAYDWFRKKDDRYKDGGEWTWESFAKGIGLNMLTNGAGLFIGGKVVLEFMEVFADKISGQKIFGTQAYGFDVAELEAITDAVKSSVNAVGTVSSAVRSAAAGESVDYEGLARKVWTATEDALKLAGVPLENATTMITSVAKQVMAETMGPYIGDYYALRIGADPASSKAAFYDNLYACWKKAPNSTMRELYDIMLQDGFTPDGVKSAMETRAKKDEGVGSVKELKTRWPLK